MIKSLFIKVTTKILDLLIFNRSPFMQEKY